MAHYLYVALGGENKISTFRIDPDCGQLQFRGDAALEGDPGPLCVDPGQNFLYAGLWATRKISSFGIDKNSGKLSLLSTIPVDAYSSCLNTDRSGRFLFSCSCGGGVIGVYSIGNDGAVKPVPAQWIKTMHGAHWIQADESNRYVFVSHVAHVPGSNAILQYHFDINTGRLTPNAVAKVDQPEQTGPRDFVFHPSRPFVYADNEQNSSVTAYRLDPTNGTLHVFQNISTLPPEGFAGENECSQIRIHPSGRFLYVSNRGHDSIACYAIDSETGELTQIDVKSTEANPRTFNLDRTGAFLFAAGIESGQIASYRIAEKTGELLFLRTCAVGKKPMWILSLNLDE